MRTTLMADPEVRSVPWRDLVPLTGLEVARELTLTLPWLALSLAFAHVGFLPGAVVASFFFFLTGLRNSHDGQHYNLGISRRATDVFLFVLSVLMQASLHAVQVNHLRHHRFCLGKEDFEARSARMRGWQAILYGPFFFLLLHWHGLKHASPTQRRWIIAEIATIAGWVLLVLLLPTPAMLRYHVIIMLVAQCFTAFFAVWTVHHDVDESRTIARTQRGIWNKLAYSMFFHVEHHLFPRVPTCHLYRVADRLDRAKPELARWPVLG